MVRRIIKDAKRITEGKLKGVTLITLECGHSRSLGGHVFEGRVQLPSDIKGKYYPCEDSHCHYTRG